MHGVGAILPFAIQMFRNVACCKKKWTENVKNECQNFDLSNALLQLFQQKIVVT
jgi:hypothetical protein